MAGTRHGKLPQTVRNATRTDSDATHTNTDDRRHGIDGQAAKVTADVTLNTDGGFSLAVELKVSVPGADKDKVQALVEEAHTVCPYSKATKGNIPVKLTVV